METRARSSGDRAPDSGSGCRGFKSLRARHADKLIRSVDDKNCSTEFFLAFLQTAKPDYRK